MCLILTEFFFAITSSSEDQLNKHFQHSFWKGRKENLNLLTTDLILIPRLRMKRLYHHVPHTFRAFHMGRGIFPVFLTTPCGRVPLEQLIITQLVENLPAFYGTQVPLPCSNSPPTGHILDQMNPIYTFIKMTHFKQYV